jgi:DNA (cytosine-5)-methyltransferase 1
MMPIGSLFAGIGGLELGLERAGLGPVRWQVEIDLFCRAVLATHWPDARRYEDIRSVNALDLEPVDIICGGFPCQDISSARSGTGRGLEGKRSGLWREFARIIEAARPRFVVVENVASGAGKWLCAVRFDLHQRGYRTRALGIAASDCGAPHRRSRIFIVAEAEAMADSARERGRRIGGCELASAEEDGQAIAGRRAPSRRPWTAESDMGRVVDGLSRGLARNRLERLRALGNAVVPQCAEIVGEVIMQRLREAP